MSDYESETESQREIRQQRGLATGTELTPTRVQRAYSLLHYRQGRRPPPPVRRTRMEPDTDTDDFNTNAFLDSLFPLAGVGAPPPPVVVSASPPPSASVPITYTTLQTAPVMSTGVGVGGYTTRLTSPRRTPTPPPIAATGIGLGTTPTRSTSPRTPPLMTTGVGMGSSTSTRSSVNRRRRRMTRRRGRGGTTTATTTIPVTRTTTTAAAGGDGGGGGSSDDGGGSGGPRRRNLHNDLDGLLARLRRRANGRRIAGITHTDTITTTYKDGGPPTVRRSSHSSSG